MHRRALLTSLAVTLALPARARDAPQRFWPVVTTNPRALEISTETTSRPLRRFNAPRPAAHADHPTRRHVGVDLFADPGDTVIAIEDGIILANYPFLRAATGQMSWCVLIAHAGYVATYGEVQAGLTDVWNLRIGDRVQGGQFIANISDTGQLHFETYDPSVTRNISWPNGAPEPAGVRDPTRFLTDLAAHGRRMLISELPLRPSSTNLAP
ncbi:MAG TPA: M23 family metallopeptidase [Vitreimonas sp.]|jgi:murein DD-endopeptidase MepM/ murein hydrolase activator NlpD|nr:M23 family metallopeptidase [Vitreimonas sp.]